MFGGGSLKTKLYNLSIPLFGFSIVCLILFSIFHVWVGYEKKYLESVEKDLDSPSNRSFAVLQEFQTGGKKFTYEVSDEWGKVHEVTEVVDEASARKLRVGDTIPVLRKSVHIFGKQTMLSRIISNSNKPQSFEILQNITFYSIFFFGLVSFATSILFFVNKPE